MRTQLIFSTVVVCLAVGFGVACSDDDAGDSTDKDSGADEETGGGSGKSGGSGGKSGGSGTGGKGASGTGGKGGSGTGGSAAGDAAVDGGEGERCGVVTCDPVATCDESGSQPKCVCPDGYTDPSGFGTKCEAEDAPECEDNGDCDDDGFCVGGVCCSSACDEPPACKTAEGATCADHETCVYPDLANDTVCDDGTACTENDVCTDGVCAGSAITCDDDNVCTADTCDPEEGCVFDGTGIDTADCKPADLCNGSYKCAKNKRGDCIPADDAAVVKCDGDDCNEGVCDPATGTCSNIAKPDNAPCNDDDACTVGDRCQAGVCVPTGPNTCEDNNPCTMDTCNGGCIHTVNESQSCNDNNPCTENDHCDAVSQGCVGGSPKNCAAAGNQCNDGVCDPTDGSCDPQPKAGSGIPCNDGKLCTSNETCMAGACVDNDVDSACGMGSTACSEAANRTCTCMTSGTPGYFFDTTQRICVANVCNGNGPCDDNATCTPVFSGGSWSASCACKTGYTGNGMTCTDINECAGNPCGTFGDCTQGPPGTYTCACDGGYKSVNGKCVCDLGGTFVMRIAATNKWGAIPGTEGGQATSYSWAIRSHVYDANGTLHVTTIQCGGTTPTICGDGTAGIAAEAYSQFSDSGIFGSLADPGLPAVDSDPLVIPNALAGQPFVTPDEAVLSGIHLESKMGAWPTKRADIGTSSVPGPGANGNEAYWTDDDADGKRGVTSYATQPGGVSTDAINGVTPTAQQTFTVPTPSPSVCSRGLDYNWWPGAGDLGQCDETFGLVCRLKAFYTATRIISAFEGTINSCDRITGDVTGPYNPPGCATNPNDDVPCNQILGEARVGGCMVRTGGVGSSTEVDCDGNHGNIISDFDVASAPNNFLSSTFVIRRATAQELNGGLTCEEVRGLTF